MYYFAVFVVYLTCSCGHGGTNADTLATLAAGKTQVDSELGKL